MVSAASAAVAEAAAPANAGSKLVQWVVQNGGSIHKVKLVMTPATSTQLAQRELLVTEAVEPGDILISVSRHCQLRYDNISDYRLLHLFEQLPRSSSGTASSAWQFLQGLALLWHIARAEASPLQHYISLLPGLVPGVPTPRVGMLMSSDAVQQLQYMPIIEDVLNQQYWWEEVWSKTLPAVRSSAGGDPFEGLEISKQAFGWAVAVTNSRTFGLSRARTHTMVPLIDMINHDPANVNCEVSSDWEGTVTLSATRKIKPGEPLFLSYGRHDCRNLLLSYGFITPNNPLDIFQFDFDADSMMDLIAPERAEPRLAGWQQQVLVKLGLVPPPSAATPPGESATNEVTAPVVNTKVYLRPVPDQSALTITSNGATASSTGRQVDVQPVDPRLLAALRVMTLRSQGEGSDGEQAMVESMTMEQLGDWKRPLARQHELDVLATLIRLCTALYQGLGSTLQQDRALEKQLQQALAAVPVHASRPTQDDGGANNAGGLALAGLDLHLPDPAMDARDTLLAIQYRISIKRCLEGALQAVVARRKDLSS